MALSDLPATLPAQMQAPAANRFASATTIKGQAALVQQATLSTHLQASLVQQRSCTTLLSGQAALVDQESVDLFYHYGVVALNKESHGFVRRNSGEADLFVMPVQCQGFNGAIPSAGTHVLFKIGKNSKTGKPCATAVKPAEYSGTMMPRKDDKWGFIRPDAGDGDLFVMPRQCVALGGVLPPAGTRVTFVLGTNPQNGKPCAEQVEQIAPGERPMMMSFSCLATSSKDPAPLALTDAPPRLAITDVAAAGEPAQEFDKSLYDASPSEEGMSWGVEVGAGADACEAAAGIPMQVSNQWLGDASSKGGGKASGANGKGASWGIAAEAGAGADQVSVSTSTWVSCQCGDDAVSKGGGTACGAKGKATSWSVAAGAGTNAYDAGQWQDDASLKGGSTMCGANGKGTSCGAVAGASADACGAAATALMQVFGQWKDNASPKGAGKGTSWGADAGVVNDAWGKGGMLMQKMW